MAKKMQILLKDQKIPREMGEAGEKEYFRKLFHVQAFRKN